MSKILKRTAASIAIFLLATLIAACGSDQATPTREESPQTQLQQPTQTAGPTNTRLPIPTRPTPLADLANATTQAPQPTEEQATEPERATAEEPTPEVAKTQAPATEQESTQPPNQGQNGLPQDPATDDTVLLQDIYEQMDLSQYALAVDQPLDFNLGNNSPVQKFPYHETRNHPYIHLFPGLKYMAEHQGHDRALKDRDNAFRYSPWLLGKPQESTHEIRISRGVDYPGEILDPITHFIYNPWFEQYPGRTDSEAQGIHFSTNETFPYYRRGYGPFWFGKNSTRGVLAQAVAKAFEEAEKPGTTPHPLDWQTEYMFPGEHDPRSYLQPKDWDLESYVRTTVNRYLQTGQDHNYIYGFLQEDYSAPLIRWEFLHPSLPIIKVTAHNEKNLPFIHPGQAAPTPTQYSVAFVITFQNRWESLDDPNRWAIRFENQLKDHEVNLSAPMTTRNPDNIRKAPRPKDKQAIGASVVHEPGRWHYTDYMQHSIIGPVIVQIHKSDVLETGMYAITPKVSRWEAPGYLASDEQLNWPLIIGSVVDNQAEKITSIYYDVFGIVPSPSASPNPNWPLPDHVMATDQTKPGTQVWEEYNIDDHDW